MKNNFTLRWTIANALGMSLGFLSALQFLMFYQYGLDFDKHWQFGSGHGLSENSRLISIGFGLAIFGAIFSSAQAIILNKYLPKVWPWVLYGTLGYMVVLLIIWPFISIWGSIPGPVEPLTLVLGGTLFMLVLHWRYLKKHGVEPARPILWFGAGFLLGLLPVVLLFMFIWPNVPWGVDIAIMGVLMGGAAGLLSAKHFQKVLEERSM
jgi:MFS family permease